MMRPHWQFAGRCGIVDPLPANPPIMEPAMSRPTRSLLVIAVTLGVLSSAVAWQAATKNTAADGIVPALQRTGPRYWKGNLHTHSLWSDGDDFPEMIADWYKRHGYDFLALTDHNVLSEGERWIDVKADKENRETALKKYLARFGAGWVEQRDAGGKPQVRLKPLAEFRNVLEEPGRFLLIPGEEVTHRFSKYPVHMNAINVRDVIRPADGPSVAETVTVNLRGVVGQRKRTGWRTIAVLNHPNFGWGVKAEDMLAEELRYFEVFNGHPGVRNYGDELHASTERIWDIILALRLGKHNLPIVYGLGSDDAHGYHSFGTGKANPGRGWIMVRAPHLTAEAMVRGIEAGDFYPSSGVRFKDVRRNGNALHLVIDAEPGVKYHTQFIATRRGAPLDSQPRLDKDGNPLEVTRVYSPEIGRVVAESDSLEPSYPFAGDELYVRAKVVSTKPHPNPFQTGDVEVAWTQPIVP
jgi:hypothetical protein